MDSFGNIRLNGDFIPVEKYLPNWTISRRLNVNKMFETTTYRYWSFNVFFLDDSFWKYPWVWSKRRTVFPPAPSNRLGEYLRNRINILHLYYCLELHSCTQEVMCFNMIAPIKIWQMIVIFWGVCLTCLSILKRTNKPFDFPHEAKRLVFLHRSFELFPLLSHLFGQICHGSWTKKKKRAEETKNLDEFWSGDVGWTNIDCWAPQ